MMEPCAVPYKPSTNIEQSGNRLGVGIGRNKSMVQMSFSGKTSPSKMKRPAPYFLLIPPSSSPCSVCIALLLEEPTNYRL